MLLSRKYTLKQNEFENYLKIISMITISIIYYCFSFCDYFITCWVFHVLVQTGNHFLIGWLSRGAHISYFL